MLRNRPDKYGRGSAAANGAGFVDLAPGDTFDGLEAQLRARISEVYVNRTLGLSATIGSKRNANELAKHLAPKENEEAHKFAAKNLGLLFEHGVLGIRHLDKKAMPGQRWIVRFIRVFSPFVFAGVRHFATITLKECGQGDSIYSVEAVDITKDADSERTPRGAMSEDLNAAPFLELAPLLERSIAYYVGECNRTFPEFVNRPEPFSVVRAAELLATPVMEGRASKRFTTEVMDWLAQARNAGYMLTNLFPDERKIADWARRDAVSLVSGYSGCRLLVVHEDGFDRLYYAANSFKAAALACKSYFAAHVAECVLDVVGPQTVQTEAAEAFMEAGFGVRKTLTRMQRRKAGETASPVSRKGEVREVTVADARIIYDALRQFFDMRAEQLPSLEEVELLCDGGASFVVPAECGGIAAFLLGELQGKKGQVRYWFTMPPERGKGVGGSVMQAFFEHCRRRGSTFQELWVLDDNEAAIRCYEHYGFAFDRLKDTVYDKEKA